MLAELHRGPDDARRLAAMVRQPDGSGVPLVGGQRRALSRARSPAAARRADGRSSGCTVAEAGELLFANAERI